MVPVDSDAAGRWPLHPTLLYFVLTIANNKYMLVPDVILRGHELLQWITSEYTPRTREDRFH